MKKQYEWSSLTTEEMDTMMRLIDKMEKANDTRLLNAYSYVMHLSVYRIEHENEKED